MDDLQLREGQNVRVTQKIIEGKRERSVPFLGRLMKVRGSGINKTITVKQNLEGVDVERIFPIASPTLIKIEIVEEKKVKTRTSRKTRKSSKKK